jgi:sialic acid synthase SpsE
MSAALFIVAEIGMNHMGDPAYADAYLDALAPARLDGITFQVREKAYYEKQIAAESTQLDDSYYAHAADRVHDAGIAFGVALCDLEKLPLFSSIGTDFYKILSKDIGDRRLIKAVAATGKPIYVSTGMSDEDEIAELILDSAGFDRPLSLIHTQLSYDDGDTNLRAIPRLQKRFNVPIAFGSHAVGTQALYAAAAFEPAAIFFYVKGGRAVEHKDEDHAVHTAAVADVVTGIRRVETMLGSGTKVKMSNRIPAQNRQ